jgi:DNA-binding GntR family transcriptional regulator
VSRFPALAQPVREAIRILTAEGLIEPARNRGVPVRRAEAEGIIQTFSVIGTLEAMAGRTRRGAHFGTGTAADRRG